MAELPRYQQTGRIFADVPQLDFASVRENINLSRSMGNALDRISAFAGKYSEQQVAKQAEQFAVENPITIEQLRIAKESGIDPNELIAATGGGAIWEETLRKFQGEQLRAQLEVFGQSALADIQSQVQTGQLNDINEIKSKFATAITGYEAPLNRINPESAVRFKQSMAATANAFYKEATKKLEQDYINDQQILSQQNFEVSVKAAKSMINAINDPQMLSEARELMFKRVYEQAREGGTAFAQVQAEKFLKEFDALKINSFVETALSDEFYTNPLTNKRDALYAYNKLVAGQVPGKENIWQQMDYQEKAKVFNAFRERENELAATRKQEETFQHEEDLLQVNKILLDYYDNGKRDKKLFKQLEEISVRNPKAFSAKDLDELRKSGSEDVEKNMSKWAYSDDVTRLKVLVTTDPSASWDSIKSIGLSYGIPSNVINRYVFPYYANPNERNYQKDVQDAVPNYGSDAGAKQFKKNEEARLNSIVTTRIKNLISENDKLPTEKRKPIPSKSEMLQQVISEEEGSKKTILLEQTIQEANQIISSRRIIGIELNKNSSTKDPVLMRRINALDAETKQLIMSYIQKIERNRM